MLYFVACIYLVMYYIRPFEWVPGMVGIPIFVVLCVVAFLLLVINFINGKIRLFSFNTDIFMVGFFGAILLSHITHGYLHGMIDGAIKFFPVFIGYFLFAHALDTYKKYNCFLLLLIFLTAFLAYQGYLQVTTGHAYGGLEPLYQRVGYDESNNPIYVTRIRWYGVFNDPNDLGLALVLIVPVLIDRVFQKRFFLSALLLPVILYGIYWTNSRGAMLSLAAGIFAYLVLRYRSLKGVIIGGVMAVIGVVFGPSRMGSLSGSEESAYGRIEAWYSGFQMFKSSPLFGVGQGMFTEYHNLTAHNSYMLVLAELGLLGSIFFVGMFYISLLWTKNYCFLGEALSSEIEKQNRSQACALSASLVGVMAAIFFLSRSYVLLPFLIIALMVRFSTFRDVDLNQYFVNPFQAPIKWRSILSLIVIEIIFINIVVKVLV